MFSVSTILNRVPKEIENNRVYNFLEESASGKFYNELFSEKSDTAAKPELFEQLKEQSREKHSVYAVMEEVVSLMEKILPENAIVLEIGGGIYQQRSANAVHRFNNYFPLDISYSSIKRYTEKYNKIGFVSDAEKLPFDNNSIDCIFTHTFLEHPLEPENVLEEIGRVLKPGGIIIHNDAWFCRWWQRYGIVGLTKYDNLTFKEKLIYLAAELTELKFIRVPPIILRRLIKLFFRRSKTSEKLAYKKLQPNYKLHLGCDEDAASSIDPLDVIHFYESRNFKLLEPLSFKARLLHPNKYIALKKSV